MEFYTIDSGGELHHWGIKGMKWGRRRYQNKDGSLTPEGRKRYGDGDSGGSDSKPKKKSIGEMSDDELRSAIARKQLENQYKQYHPDPVKKESFVGKFVSDAVKPALISSGRKALEAVMDKTVKDLLKDKVDPDSYEALKKTYDKLEIKGKIKKLQKSDEPDEYETLKKQHDILDMKKKIEKLEKGDSDGDDSYDALLKQYRDTPEELRNEIKNAAGFAENLNKLKKKKSD